MRKNKKNYRIKNIFSNQKGMALLTTLIFVFILVTFAVALLTMTSNDSKLSTLQRDSTKAFYQADAGIEKAIWYLNSSKLNTDGLYFVGELEGGTATEFYNVEVFEIDTTGPVETKTLISTGKVVGGGEYNKGTRKIEVKLIKGITPSTGLTYDHAIFADKELDFKGGISITGDIHSNGNLYVSSTEVFNLVDGEATASGTNDYGDSGVEEEDFPEIDWEYFKGLAEEEINGGHYYNEETYIFNVPKYLTGIHYVDGNVIIKTDLILENATIVANGTITVLGSGSINLVNDLIDHPLALVAAGDITNGGSIHGEGIIQTYGSFTNNGVVNIQEGAIYADTGVFNGGGGVEFNIYYATDLIGVTVLGTGIPIWRKTSWREVY